MFFYYPFNGCTAYSYISYFFLDIGDLCCLSYYVSVLPEVYWFFPDEPAFYFIYFLCFSFSTLFMSALTLLFSSICRLWLYFALLLLAFWHRNIDINLRPFLFSNIIIYCYKLSSQYCCSCIPQIFIFYILINLVLCI